MDSNQGNVQEIVFPNGNRAKLLTVSASADPADIISTLGIVPPKIMIVISGGADNLTNSLKPRLAQLFSRGIARVAAEANALIIDGGTQSGVMEMMGQGVADRDRQSLLLGVAPAGLVTYPGEAPTDESAKSKTPLDPNHSHFVLVDSGQWGGETKMMYNLAAALGQNARVVTVLVNGGAIAKQEILASVRNGWPVIVFEKSERLADEIANLWQKKKNPPKIGPWEQVVNKRRSDTGAISDEVMAEIIADGDIHFFKLDGSVNELQQLLKTHLGQVNPTLADAWRCFALYDQNAISAQSLFLRLRNWILVLGVVATFLPILYSTLSFSSDQTLSSFKTLLQNYPGVAIFLNPILQYSILDITLGSLLQSVIKYSIKGVIIAAPIIISVLVAGSVKFERGGKWVLLRNSAEAIKKEIYRYRAKAEIYSPEQTTDETRDIKLARKVKSIGQELMKTQVNQEALEPYSGQIPPAYGAAQNDDGFSDLNADVYLACRLDDQSKWYQRKALGMTQQLRRRYWLVYIFGGVGTFLAATGFDIWIPVTVALASALTAYLEMRRLEPTITAYNQAASNLHDIRIWWRALRRDQQNRENFQKLVQYTEDIIATEHAGWVQEMRDALAELYKETQASDQTQKPDSPQHSED